MNVVLTFVIFAVGFSCAIHAYVKPWDMMYCLVSVLTMVVCQILIRLNERL